MIFLVPVPWDGELTIGIGIITNWVKALLGDLGLRMVITIMLITCIMTVLGTVFKVPWLIKKKWLQSLFQVPVIWLLIRVIGTAFGCIYLFQVGPELLRSEEIGGLIFDDLALHVLAVFIVACLLMPLLTDYGFMELVGTLARPVFRRVFRLPGRAAIDATASFVGASSIGVLITIGQYENKFYTGREAAVVAVNFSVVSIPFTLVVASIAGISHLYVPWYAFVVLACLTAAMITPRLPPLLRKEDKYIDGTSRSNFVTNEAHGTLLAQAWQKAIDRASNSPGVAGFFISGGRNLAFFLFSILAASLALATIALILAFHTPIFAWISYPFVPILDLLQIQDAGNAAPALFSGFLDAYNPALVAGTIDNQVTSFLLAGLSVCQLIYMSEVGVIILRSKLPLGLVDLMLIFILRTVIVLPILTVGAHLIV